MIPWHDTDFYTPHSSMGVTASAVTVALLGVVGAVNFILVAAGCMRQASLRARAARAAEESAERRALRPGLAVLHGQVETEDGTPPIRITIDQSGRQYQVKNGIRHRWTEFDRRVDVRPFFLRLAGGERVKVVPGEDVFLIDLLATKSEDPSKATRTRVAELTAKDMAYVVGRLVAPHGGSAYRTVEEGFSLEPVPGERMTISSEPLEARYARRASFHRGWLFAAIAGCLVLNGLLFGGYWLSLIAGQPIAADAVNVRTWTTRGKHGSVSHYAVDATATIDGREVRLTSDTNLAFYEEVRTDLPQGSISVPFLVVPSQLWTAMIGTRPTLSGGRGFFAGLFLVVLVIAYALNTRHTRPWYERKRVVDVGTGPLGENDELE